MGKTTDKPLPEIIHNMPNAGLLRKDEVTAILTHGVESVLGPAVDSSEVFGGADVLSGEDKQLLVDKPFVLLDWRFNEGEFSGEFASARVVTEDNRLYVVNDGSKGIYAQLRELTEQTGKQRGPIACRKGLTVSEYWYDEATGTIYKIKPDKVKTIPAKTFYLS